MIIYDLWSNQPFGLHPYRSKNTLLCINMQVFRKYKRCLHPLHLPSGRIVSPFWKIRTPFWKMRTPFWKAACVVSKYQPGCNLGSTKTIRNLLILSCGARGASTLCFFTCARKQTASLHSLFGHFYTLNRRVGYAGTAVVVRSEVSVEGLDGIGRRDAAVMVEVGHLVIESILYYFKVVV